MAAISIHDLGKRYKLGVRQHDTLRDHLAALFRRQKKAPEDEFWAIRNLNFEIQQGEVVGIVGRNGAGKSTLLKVLSQITEPTEGEVRIHGRVASLLEVGTGFHPELTGAENIYLNGAILGMSRREIRARFDEIVAFAEVEKFISTPVKHYSSGMYVRLAFAVAAHLDPEILIVDEVLAVGDAAFQQKCTGKMSEVASREGRTVLFVSHNTAVVRSLCTRCVLLSRGAVEKDGDSASVIDAYVASFQEATDTSATLLPGDFGRGEHLSLHFDGTPRFFQFNCGADVKLDFSVVSPEPLQGVGCSVSILSLDGSPLVSMSSKVQALPLPAGSAKTWKIGVDLGRVPINVGNYRVRVYISEKGRDVARFSDAFTLQVQPYDVFGWGNALPSPVHWGPFYCAPTWRIEPGA